jgi:hypothetical protein
MLCNLMVCAFTLRLRKEKGYVHGGLGSFGWITEPPQYWTLWQTFIIDHLKPIFTTSLIWDTSARPNYNTTYCYSPHDHHLHNVTNEHILRHKPLLMRNRRSAKLYCTEEEAIKPSPEVKDPFNMSKLLTQNQTHPSYAPPTSTHMAHHQHL